MQSIIKLAVASLALVASAVTAAPVPQGKVVAKKPDIDTIILNYALTLEHLENAFYREGLAKFDAAAFKAAGFPKYVRNRYAEIGHHEKQHVAFLSSALGSKATKACTYNFGVTDVKSFVATSQLLEGVGVSAYLGAAASITNPAYLTAAGSILSTEARHESWVNSIGLLDDAFPKPFDTPLNFNQTFSLAAPLIKNCPKTNPKLPVVAFPKLSLKPSVPRGGATVTVTADKLSSGKYLAFLSGLQTYYAPVTNGKATVPQEIGYGRVYAVLVKSKKVTDDTTVAGPFAFDIPNKI